MNRSKRFCVIAGLAATLGMGIVPGTASAAVSEGASKSKPMYEVDDWFDNKNDCVEAGKDGSDDGTFDMYKCTKLRQGTNEGWYLLWVVYA